jgi:hypothetical protein
MLKTSGEGEEMGAEVLTLSGQQQALYAALIEKEHRLASMYHGALAVFGQHNNPDRLALAAHGLRELMEKLPRYLNLPTETQPKLTEKLRSLNQSWDRTVAKSKCHENGKWNGEIDKVLQEVLAEIEGFFGWVNEQVPKRKESTARILRTLDALGRALPAPIEALHIEQWDLIHRFFISVGHHQRAASDEEFTTWLAALETFLLDQLTPRTFEDHAKIDAIIKEGEGIDRS